MSGEHMRAPQWKFEWNVNTVLGVLTLVGMFVVGGMGYRDLQRNDDAVVKWQLNHEASVKEKTAEFSAQLAGANARLSAAEDKLDDLEAALDRNTYRVTAIEATWEEDKAQRAKIIDTLSDQAGELRVIREILSRIEEKQGGAPRPSSDARD